MEASEGKSFTTKEIYILLALIGQSPLDAAAAINEDRTTVSKVINRHRPTSRVAKKFARHVAVEVEKRILATA